MNREIIEEWIKKNNYKTQNYGLHPTKIIIGEAKKRLRQIEYFKHLEKK